LAAQRYAYYWEKRVEIFGHKRAFQPFTLGGALKDDTAALELGVFQPTGQRDPTGRSILFIDPSRLDHKKYTRESMCRVFWYFLQTALEDLETQKKGIIILAYAHETTFWQLDRQLLTLIAQSLRGCLPVRLSCIHICEPPSFFSIIFPIVKFFITGRLQQRIRVHSGGDWQVQQELLKCGLDKSVLPTQIGGDVTLDLHKWLARRRKSGL
jgi:hypothetical protein